MLRSLVPALLLASCTAATHQAPRISLTLGGEMTYMADAPRITECMTGRSYPLAQEGDYLALERAYSSGVKSPGAPLYVTLDGAIDQRPKMDGEGTQATVVVERYINIWPAQACERARADASLANTYWRIVRVAGQAVAVVEGRREPSLTLRSVDGRPGFSATVGCNQLGGSFEQQGDALTFGSAMSTLMACPPPLGDLERRLAGVLAETRRWKITGPTLELSGQQGQSLALLEAVHLP